MESDHPWQRPTAEELAALAEEVGGDQSVSDKFKEQVRDQRAPRFIGGDALSLLLVVPQQGNLPPPCCFLRMPVW